MERINEAQLEALVQRQLSQLPPHKAPSTLMPRVMAAIQRRAQLPWWKRPVWTWPRSTQWLIAMLILSVLVTGFSLAATATTFTDLWEYWAGWQTTWAVLRTCGEILIGALIIIIRSMGKPWMLAFLGAGLAMYIFCLGTGTLFYRLAVKRA